MRADRANGWTTSHPGGSSGVGHAGSGRQSGHGSVNGGSRRSTRPITASPSARTRSPVARSTSPRSSRSANSSSSFQRHVRSGSTTTSSIMSIASNPSAVRRSGRWRLTYQPKWRRRPTTPRARASRPAAAATGWTRPTRGRRTPSLPGQVLEDPLAPGRGLGAAGGVAGTLRRVPCGIHRSSRSSVSSTTTSGRAAHTRPPQTSWCTMTSPGVHTGGDPVSPGPRSTPSGRGSSRRSRESGRRCAWRPACRGSTPNRARCRRAWPCRRGAART